MNKKIFIIPLLGEFIIIIILVALNFTNVTTCNNKCENPKNDNSEIKDEINYECISVNQHKDSEYTLKHQIKTNFKGKILDIKTEHKYVYTNKDKYDSMRDSYEVDKSKYELEFKDETKTMILTEKEANQDILETSIIYYEEHLIENGYTCEIIK